VDRDYGSKHAPEKNGHQSVRGARKSSREFKRKSYTGPARVVIVASLDHSLVPVGE
jgi:hypothetical protein